MRRYFLFLILLINCVNSNVAAAKTTNELSEIYIESRGNNQYEAKIRALDKGMRRAFIIWADKLGVDDENLRRITYFELKTAFEAMQIRNENIKSFSSGAYYSAIVKFTFNRAVFNHLIQKYASAEVKAKFYKTIILPVSKVGNNLLIAPKLGLWGSAWEKQRGSLEENKIFYPLYEKDLVQQITTQNILQLGYNEILAYSPVKLVNQLVIPIGEFFTNRVDGSSYLQIKLIISNYSGTEIKTQKYNLPNTKKATQELIEKIVHQFIENYGEYNKEIKDDSDMALLPSLANIINPKPTQKFYVMAGEIFSDADLDRIKAKLAVLPNIDRFNIKPDPVLGFKIKLYTDATEEQLAEILYFNGLSFYKKKNYSVLVETSYQ